MSIEYKALWAITFNYIELLCLNENRNNLFITYIKYLQTTKRSKPKIWIILNLKYQKK